MHSVITGKGGISASIIQDSISSTTGVRLVTMELTYPRFIHSEFMTHRMLSKNAASSRAIPIKTMIELVRTNKQAPIHWGKNMPGMQAKEELTGQDLERAQMLWDVARAEAIQIAERMLLVDAHKQIVNRLLEPFTQMKVVVSGTEWENFFWLRDHEDAQPEIRELARVMRIAFNSSRPLTVFPGSWHVPYIRREKGLGGIMQYFSGGSAVTVEEAKIISASCCAQVSYRKSDDSLEKALMVFNRLIGSEPVHASPIEHQATPARNNSMWDKGITHISNNGDQWSGNFRYWIQNRQTIPGHSQMDI